MNRDNRRDAPILAANQMSRLVLLEFCGVLFGAAIGVVYSATILDESLTMFHHFGKFLNLIAVWIGVGVLSAVLIFFSTAKLPPNWDSNHSRAPTFADFRSQRMPPVRFLKLLLFAAIVGALIGYFGVAWLIPTFPTHRLPRTAGASAFAFCLVLSLTGLNNIALVASRR